MAEIVNVFVDGIYSISSHNNVHRIVCYTLDAVGQAEMTVELIIPAASLAGLVEALDKVKG
jgi:hypothetical protein